MTLALDLWGGGLFPLNPQHRLGVKIPELLLKLRRFPLDNLKLTLFTKLRLFSSYISCLNVCFSLSFSYLVHPDGHV